MCPGLDLEGERREGQFLMPRASDAWAGNSYERSELELDAKSSLDRFVIKSSV